MKIAYLSTFYPFRGGIAQFNASLCREFEKHHEVRAFTFTRQYPDFLFPGETQFVGEGDVVDRIDAARVLDTVNPFTWPGAASAIRRFSPDLLLMKFWMPFFAPSLGFVAGRLRKSGTRVVTILDNVIPHERRPGDIALTRYFLRRNDGFIAMSRIVERDLLSLKPGAAYQLKPHPIYDHFGPRIDTADARRRLGIPVDKKVILFFGFIRRYKGLDNIIRAMAHLSDEYLLLVAGEVYGDFAEYQRVIDETGTSSKIMLNIRYIDDAEVPAFFSAADVGVLPYKSATQSGIAQIAYAFDLPQIATNVGGLGEMIEHGVTGLMLNSQDERELAATVRRYFDENMKARLTEGVLDRKAGMSWPGFAGAILDLDQRLQGR